MKCAIQQQRWFIVFSLSLSFCVLSVAPADGQDEAAARAALRTGADDAADETEEVVVYPDAEGVEEDRPLAARVEDQKRRAGEQILGEPEGRAVVLGMYVQEADNKRVKVIEVAAASPAFDAGIKKGDEIVSFDGFKADTYRKWINGIGKMINDAPEGRSMPIQIVRDGRRLDLRMRKPESNADNPRFPTPRALSQQLPAEPQAQSQQQQLVPFGYDRNQPHLGFGGDNILVSDFFNGQLDDQLGGTTQRAVAEIFSLNVPHAGGAAAGEQLGAGVVTEGAEVDAAPDLLDERRREHPRAATGATGGGARLGLAGFRNEQTGMLVMLDIGGLAPGTYLVGIDDPGVIAAGLRGGNIVPRNIPQPAETSPRGVLPPGSVPRDQDLPEVPGVDPQQQNAPPSPETQRFLPADGRGQPADAERRSQGDNTDQSNRQQPTTTVLAQVTDDDGSAAEPVVRPARTPPTGSVTPPRTPPTGRTQPPRPPATGEVPEEDASVTGRRDLRDEAQAGVADDGQFGIGTSAVGTGGFGTTVAPTLNQIGVLTVDQTGRGQMRQVVEGVQVADVLGLALVVYSQDVPMPPQPPAAGTSIAPPARSPRNIQQDAAPQAVGGQPRAGAVPAGAQQQGVVGPQQSARSQVPGAAPGLQQGGGSLPVAAGIIRLISDRRPAGSVGQQPAQEPLR